MTEPDRNDYRDAFRIFAEETDPDPRAVRRVRNRLERSTRGTDAALASDPVEIPPGAEERVKRRLRESAASLEGRRTWPFRPLAAALIAAAAAAVIWIRSADRAQSPAVVPAPPPIASAPLAKEEAPSVVEPAPVRSARVADLAVTGKLDRARAKSALSKVEPMLSQCHQSSFPPGTRVAVSVVVDGSGVPKNVSVDPEDASGRRFLACIAPRLSAIRFPDRSGELRASEERTSWFSTMRFSLIESEASQ